MKKVSFLLFFALTLFLFSNANAQTPKKDGHKSGKKGVVKPQKDVIDTGKSLPDKTMEHLKGDSNNVSILPDTATPPPPPVPPATSIPPPPPAPPINTTTPPPPPVPPAL